MWASSYIEKLKKGETVKFRPTGNSMNPKIKSGQLCTVEPIIDQILKFNDIVLCQVGKSQYLHLISAIDGDRFQISNNKGYVNGWIERTDIFGLLIKVEN